MRLINVHTLQLHEFFGSQIPEFQYAILSHTWEEEEVTFPEFQSLSSNPAIRNKKGFSKIHLTCQQAKDDGLEWAWVDTCCIDKASSAELSEAINSMYAWYKKSKVCYAHLTDVATKGGAVSPEKVRESRWFTRGWTLQELIAPPLVNFYGENWAHLGSRSTLYSHINAVTGIPYDVLCADMRTGFHSASRLEKYSVAQRMSWASKRQTTREEDMAYCLLGLFDIHMPVLYGEGSKAFIRLQEEIIKQIDDHSLFAWTVAPEDSAAWSLGSVLAASPAAFASCSEIESMHGEVGKSSVLTKKGLYIHAPIRPLELPDTTRLHNYGAGSAYSRRGLHPQLFELVLNCSVRLQKRVTIWILRTNEWGAEELNGHTFSRIMAPGIRQYTGRITDNFARLSDDFHRVYLSTKPRPSDQPFVGGGFHFHGVPLLFCDPIYNNFSEPLWDKGWSLVTSNEPGYVGSVIRGSYDINPTTDHRQHRVLRNRLFGSFWREQTPGCPITTKPWEARMADRATIYGLILVGDPMWKDSPVLICGTVGSTDNSSGSGLLCQFANSKRSYDDWLLRVGSGREDSKNDHRPPIICPNGNTGELAMLQAKCGKTIIEILICREPTTHAKGTGLASEAAQARPHFLFLLNSYSTGKEVKDKSSMLHDYSSLGRLGRINRDVNSEMTRFSRMRVKADSQESIHGHTLMGPGRMVPIEDMLQERRKKHMDRIQRDGGKPPREAGGYLEWWRLYIFDVLDNGRRMPRIHWETKL